MNLQRQGRAKNNRNNTLQQQVPRTSRRDPRRCKQRNPATVTVTVTRRHATESEADMCSRGQYQPERLVRKTQFP